MKQQLGEYSGYTFVATMKLCKLIMLRVVAYSCEHTLKSLLAMLVSSIKDCWLANRADQVENQSVSYQLAVGP